MAGRKVMMGELQNPVALLCGTTATTSSFNKVHFMISGITTSHLVNTTVLI